MIDAVGALAVLVDHRRRRDQPVPSVNAALADEAIEMVWADPSRAGVLANEALTGAVAEDDIQAESKAAHALGLVAYEQNDRRSRVRSRSPTPVARRGSWSTTRVASSSTTSYPAPSASVAELGWAATRPSRPPGS